MKEHFKFQDYLMDKFQNKYILYCDSININLTKAYYNIYILVNIKKYTNRIEPFEKASKLLLQHLHHMIWYDLILCMTRILECSKKDRLTIHGLNKDIYNNLKNANIKFCSMKYDEEKFKKLQKIRENYVAHTLDNNFEYKVTTDEVLVLLDQIRQIFNNRQFIVDDKLYAIDDNCLLNIEKNAKKGIEQLIKPGIMDSFK